MNVPAEADYTSGSELKRLPSISVRDFIKFIVDNKLDELVVQNLSHWKVLRAPFYHEFLTVTAGPISVEEQGSITESLRALVDHNGCISFRMDRGRVSDRRLPKRLNQVIGSHQQHIDTTEFLQPTRPPLSKGSLPFVFGYGVKLRLETSLSRKQDQHDRSRLPTPFSLRLFDICHFLKWIALSTNDYHLLYRNCWSHAASLMHLVRNNDFQYEYDVNALPPTLPSRLATAGDETGHSMTHAHGLADESTFEDDDKHRGMHRVLIPESIRRSFSSPSAARISWVLRFPESIAKLIPKDTKNSDSLLSERWLPKAELKRLKRMKHDEDPISEFPSVGLEEGLMKHPDRGVLGFLFHCHAEGSFDPVAHPPSALPERCYCTSNPNGDNTMHSIDHILTRWATLMLKRSKDLAQDHDLSGRVNVIIDAFLAYIEVHNVLRMNSRLRQSCTLFLGVLYVTKWKDQNKSLGPRVANIIIPRLLSQLHTLTLTNRTDEDELEQLISLIGFVMRHQEEQPGLITEELQALIAGDLFGVIRPWADVLSDEERGILDLVLFGFLSDAESGGEAYITTHDSVWEYLTSSLRSGWPAMISLYVYAQTLAADAGSLYDRTQHLAFLLTLFDVFIDGTYPEEIEAHAFLRIFHPGNILKALNNAQLCLVILKRLAKLCNTRWADKKSVQRSLAAATMVALISRAYLEDDSDLEMYSAECTSIHNMIAQSGAIQGIGRIIVQYDLITTENFVAVSKEDLVFVLKVISIMNPTVLPVIKKSLSQRSSLASHWWSPLAWFRRQGESSAIGGHVVDETQEKAAVESDEAPAQ